MSVPLGTFVSGSTRVSGGADGTTTTVEAAQSLGPTAGDWGWRLRDAEGANPYREVVGSYHASFGVLDVGATQGSIGTGGLLQLRGAVSTLAGHVFFSDRIDDAFAVVQTGVPGIAVSNSNQPIGVTDARGMLLVPTLRAYQVSRITIDPSNLPPDVELTQARELVVPSDRAGVRVAFDLRHDAAALVDFVRTDGAALPAGAVGHVEGGDDFTVGYDGEAFLRNLSAQNVATITFGRGVCKANFPFAPLPGEQVRIHSVVCQ